MSEKPQTKGPVVLFTGRASGVAEGTGPAVGWLVQKAAMDAGYTVNSALDAIPAGEAWSSYIKDTIGWADVVVVDLGSPSPSAMYEVGLATALNKPVLLLGSSDTKLPSDLVSRQLVHLDVGMDELQKSLVEALDRLVNAPGPVTATLVDTERTIAFATGVHQSKSNALSSTSTRDLSSKAP